jgi:hypothetical protein
MSAVDDVDELIEGYHQALDEFMKGDPDPDKKLWSHREDASLTNPRAPSRTGEMRSQRQWIAPRRPVGMASSWASRL